MTTPMIDPKGGYHKVPPAQIRIPNGVATISRPEALLKYGWKPASPERIAQEAEAERAVQRGPESLCLSCWCPGSTRTGSPRNRPCGCRRQQQPGGGNGCRQAAIQSDAQREEFRQAAAESVHAACHTEGQGRRRRRSRVGGRVAVLEDALVALLGNPAAGQGTGQVAGQGRRSNHVYFSAHPQTTQEAVRPGARREPGTCKIPGI